MSCYVTITEVTLHALVNMWYNYNAQSMHCSLILHTVLIHKSLCENMTT